MRTTQPVDGVLVWEPAPDPDDERPYIGPSRELMPDEDWRDKAERARFRLGGE